nr:formate/nitrite transporter family protein [Desulfobacterales bacterium]
MAANVDELVVRVADICTYKWDMIRHRPMAYLISGFAGGAMVVFGATLALAVSAGVSEKLAPGLANLLMGLVFMFSLVIIMVSGMTLVTADMYIGVIGVFHRRINWRWFLWGITLGYIGNFLGSMFFMWLISKSGSYAYLPWLLRSHAIGVAKLGQTASQIFVMGIVCTWMLQTAAILYVKADSDIAKIAMAAYGPLAFVAGMTEHCIANIGFLALPLFQQDFYLKAIENIPGLAPVVLHWGFGQYGWAHNQLY